MELRELTENDFSDFVKKNVSDNFLQSIEMFRRYKDINREAYLLGGLVRGKIKIAALVFCMRDIMGWKVFNMARGPILNFTDKKCFNYQNDFLKECSGFLKDKGGAVLQISPNFYRELDDCVFSDGEIPVWGEKKKFDSLYQKAGFKYLGEYGQIKWAYFKKLESEKIETKKSFRQGHRRAIKYAIERYDMKVRNLDLNELGILEKLVNESGKRHGFIGPDTDYYESMKKHFSDKVTFAVADVSDGKKKISAAAGMFIEYNGEMIYLFGGSHIGGKQVSCGPALLQWSMMKKAIDDGFLNYNFYGTHPFKDATDFSVYNFKRGFRGVIVEYLGTYAKPLNFVGKFLIKRIGVAEYRGVS